MPCNHKFKDDLNLERIDFEPETLIVGTFNPEWPASNKAEWFYGRTHDADGNRINNFWAVLPRVYDEPGLVDAGPDEWKLFCRRNRVALTDLISLIDDADEGSARHNKVLATYLDDALEHNFEDFEYVNIVQLLKRHPTIRNVYLTRGVTESFWRHLWNPVMQYCSANNIHERKLLTPAGTSLYQHEAYNTDHPDATIPLEDYLVMRWREDMIVPGSG